MRIAYCNVSAVFISLELHALEIIRPTYWCSLDHVWEFIDLFSRDKSKLTT